MQYIIFASILLQKMKMKKNYHASKEPRTKFVFIFIITFYKYKIILHVGKYSVCRVCMIVCVYIRTYLIHYIYL